MKKGSNREPAPIRYPPSNKHAKLFAKVLTIAMQYPGVEESRSYGTPSIKVKGKFMARIRSEAEGGLVLLCDIIEREMLMVAAPDVFYITDHYKDHPIVLINLETMRWEAMKDLVENAWRQIATPRLIKEFELTKKLGKDT